jgi:hypothetical protein
VCFTLVVSTAFAALASFNLANFRPVTNDEVELMAVGYKLATQGVLGSDLYTGFFGTDRHFFITLPAQHVLQAFAFHVAGAGVAQARAVSVAAAVTLVWSVGWLAYRWFGLAAAIVCELLLVAWPLNLTSAANGLSLLGVARTARYDVLAVAAVWLTLVALDAALRRPRAGSALVVGGFAGVAALTQFMGTFVLPLIALAWVWARARPRGLIWATLGAGLVLLPWVFAALVFADDVSGQLSVYAGRGEFLRPGFYVENVAAEAERYAHLLRPSSASGWLLVVGIGPALAYLAWRSRCVGSIGDRLVWSSLVVFGGLLLLLDHTKSPLYAVVLLPSICLAMSRLLTGVPAAIWHSVTLGRARAALGILAAGASGVLVLLVLLDGQAAYGFTLDQARDVSPYATVGEQIENALPPNARVLGPERWWWAAHDHSYLSLRSVWWQWMNGHEADFLDGVGWADADALIVNDNVRDDVRLFPESVQQRFWRFVDTCTAPVAALDDRTYFGIQIYRALDPHPATCQP